LNFDDISLRFRRLFPIFAFSINLSEWSLTSAISNFQIIFEIHRKNMKEYENLKIIKFIEQIIGETEENI
jgi:hypothetical protein